MTAGGGFGKKPVLGTHFIIFFGRRRGKYPLSSSPGPKSNRHNLQQSIILYTAELYCSVRNCIILYIIMHFVDGDIDLPL